MVNEVSDTEITCTTGSAGNNNNCQTESNIEVSVGGYSAIVEE